MSHKALLATLTMEKSEFPLHTTTLQVGCYYCQRGRCSPWLGWGDHPTATGPLPSREPGFERQRGGTGQQHAFICFLTVSLVSCLHFTRLLLHTDFPARVDGPCSWTMSQKNYFLSYVDSVRVFITATAKKLRD